eukprot:CAMPEP_0201499982 /NCGR_PEP_ID=MMETSP0151_2-20130828/79064_1 /ASSEMBLY_ACC=CAM_ASM_000257 /TAXON_ID=200890 /ORGANISM="Paramoeba atlantica, Strain 621/1 / CCAP 1560/9" /LENGTH=64 /DNA_ID=CAMNT_0047892815 /DNA_START=6 /DNA_END=196 /DNA_ORIENTATION=-
MGEKGQVTVAALVSDHGFGHAARMVGILREVIRQGGKVIVVSETPEWFFTESLKEVLPSSSSSS